MVGSVERINQDIAALDQTTAAMAKELHTIYSGYLTLLGKAVRQQLILASYHVCTQGYPEEFLRLSYNQRQSIQATLRQLAQQVQEELLAQLHVPVVVESREEATATEALPTAYMTTLAAEAVSETVLAEPTPSQPRTLTPQDLANWRDELEQAIAAELRTASHAANRLLQQAGVLPKRLPEPVLEAATKADLSEVGSSSTPNLLNLLVEATSDRPPDAEEPEHPRSQGVMHIVAIHLRLSEIEFADAAVGASRNQLRQYFARLKQLTREYQKKQRERAIAEAQAAWRSTWADD